MNLPRFKDHTVLVITDTDGLQLAKSSVVQKVMPSCK